MSKVSMEHPLSDFLSRQGQRRVADAGVCVTVEPFLTHINVRGHPDDTEFVSAFNSVLEQDLPKPNRVSRDQHAVYWLGPQEYLIVARSRDGENLLSELQRALSSMHAAATDVSGGQVLLTLTGSATYDLLSKASTLDFDPHVFGSNTCAQSTFAKSAALYAVRDQAPVVELIVRRSFSDYVGQWLAYAGQEFGIVFGERST